MKTLFVTSLLAILTLPSFAQDKIHLKDKSLIDGKVKEVGINEIKYYLDNTDDAPLLSIDVSNVRKIVFANGKEMEFKDPINNPLLYVDDRKNAIKLNFMSPLFENLAFAYERSVKPGRSFESEISFIGVGNSLDGDKESKGLYFGAGYKFFKSPDFYTGRGKYAHILKGSYVKPQIIVSAYNHVRDSEDFLGITLSNTRSQMDVLAAALMLNFGKQIIYDNAFLIDYSFGFGYGFSTMSHQTGGFVDDDSRANHFGFIAGGQDFPIAISAKLKIGFLL